MSDLMLAGNIIGLFVCVVGLIRTETPLWWLFYFIVGIWNLYYVLGAFR